MGEKSIYSQPGDCRLLTVYQEVDDGNLDLLSLDLFDTLLHRKVPSLFDVFLILGREFKQEGWLIPTVTIESFATLRSYAQEIARLCVSRDQQRRAEIDLNHIYMHLQRIFNSPSAANAAQGKHGIISESRLADAIAVELGVENRLICVDHSIVDLILYVKRKHIPVVVVSDTYFNVAQLQFLLSRPIRSSSTSLLSHVDKIYASSEYGYGKRDGLFQTMLQDRATPPHRTLHIGDSRDSDYMPAQSTGMRTILYEKVDRAFRSALHREWPHYQPDERLEMLDPVEGDFGLSFTRSKLRSSTAASGLKPRHAFFWKHGASVLGPIFAGVGLWAYERCRAMGQNTLFCLMREGTLYANVIKWLQPCFPDHHLEPIHLWANRRYMSTACIASGSAQELATVLNMTVPGPFTVASFSRFVGLRDNASKYEKYAGVRLLSGSDFCNAFFEHLSMNPYYREQILAAADAKRKRYLSYLKTLVNLDTTHQITLLDIGWRGTVQDVLQTILQLSGYSNTVHGLYLGTTYGAAFASLKGQIREGYLLNAGYPVGDVQVVRRGLYVLEEVAIGDSRRMVGISNDGNVITRKSIVSQRQQREALIAQQGVKAFCEALGERIVYHEICWNSSSPALKGILLKIITGLTGVPTKEEAVRYSSWQHEPACGGMVSLGNAPYYRHFIKDLLPEIAFKGAEETWQASYAARVDPFLALMSKAEGQMILPAKCFLSQDHLVLSVFMDKGAGFTKIPKRHLVLRSNANRSYFAYCRLYSPKKSIQRIKLKLPFTGLVLVRSLRFDFNHQGLEETEHRVFFEQTNGAYSGLHCSLPQLRDGVFRSNGTEALEIVFDVGIPRVFLVQLRFGCETFRIPV